MYIVTGGAGFIGSCLVAKLNAEGINDILIVDNLGSEDKWKNLVGKRFTDYIHKDAFIERLKAKKLPGDVKALLHMGACSSTVVRDADYMIENNYRYTKLLVDWSLQSGVRMVYASSAATYGDGALSYSDNHDLLKKLKPLNVYGYSKHLLDLWLLESKLLGQVCGLKFFNVYGPNEYHKGFMSSFVYKAYNQIKETGSVKLFMSHHPDYRDGEPVRDFIYVKDCVEVIWWFMKNHRVNGIFNLGTGKARSWNDLAMATFKAMGVQPTIEYIEMPESIRNQYQYFTQATMDKLTQVGCTVKFGPLEEGVRDYVQNYLSNSWQHL